MKIGNFIDMQNDNYREVVLKVTDWEINISFIWHLTKYIFCNRIAQQPKCKSLNISPQSNKTSYALFQKHNVLKTGL